jgi:hypothetical protein
MCAVEFAYKASCLSCRADRSWDRKWSLVDWRRKREVAMRRAKRVRRIVKDILLMVDMV